MYYQDQYLYRYHTSKKKRYLLTEIGAILSYVISKNNWGKYKSATLPGVRYM